MPSSGIGSSRRTRCSHAERCCTCQCGQISLVEPLVVDGIGWRAGTPGWLVVFVANLFGKLFPGGQPASDNLGNRYFLPEIHCR